MGAVSATPPATTPPAPPEPLHTASVVATEQKSPRSLVVNEGSLLWVTDEPEVPDKVTASALLALRLSDSASHVVARHQDDMEMTSNQELAVSGANVYWLSGEHERRALIGAPVSGGQTRRVLAAPKAGTVLATFGDAVYWFEYGENEHAVLKTLELAGGKATTLSVESSNALPGAIALDRQYVYWFSDLRGGSYNPAVKRTPLQGGSATVLANVSGHASAIAVDDAMVYVADPGDWNGNIPAKANIVGTIQAMPKAGGPARTLASLPGPWALAVDGRYVYFVTAGRHGKVGRIAKESGASVILADEQPFARSIALDDKFVYWVNGGTSGTLNKISK